MKRNRCHSLEYSSRIGSSRAPRSTTQLDLVPLEVVSEVAHCNLGDANSLLVAADTATAAAASSESSSWRQYVPLAVSCAVIVDILLGSPFANAAIGLLNPEANDNKDAADDDDNASSARTKQQQRLNNSRERIDTQQFAQAAIDKARNTLELQQYLENAKTDYDRMEDMKRKMDEQAAQLDKKLEERRSE